MPVMKILIVILPLLLQSPLIFAKSSESSDEEEAVLVCTNSRSIKNLNTGWSFNTGTFSCTKALANSKEELFCSGQYSLVNTQKGVTISTSPTGCFQALSQSYQGYYCKSQYVIVNSKIKDSKSNIRTFPMTCTQALAQMQSLDWPAYCAQNSFTNLDLGTVTPLEQGSCKEARKTFYEGFFCLSQYRVGNLSTGESIDVSPQTCSESLKERKWADAEQCLIDPDEKLFSQYGVR